jgi:hypothetical protein
MELMLIQIVPINVLNVIVIVESIIILTLMVRMFMLE